MNQHDDCRCQLWPDFLTAFRAFLRDVCIHPHRCTAYTAILRVLIPIEQFLTFASLQVESAFEFVVALAQTAHLVAGIIGHWGINAVGLYLRTIFHRGDIHEVRPRLDCRRRFLLKRNGISTSSGLFKQQILFAKNEVVFLSHTRAVTYSRKVVDNHAQELVLPIPQGRTSNCYLVLDLQPPSA